MRGRSPKGGGEAGRMTTRHPDVVADESLSRVLVTEAARVCLQRILPQSELASTDTVAFADVLKVLLDARPDYCRIAGFTADSGLTGALPDHLTELVRRGAF